MLYRQARGEQPFAGELAAMRARLVEVVAGMLDHALRAEGREITAVDLEVVAYALVGATESLADWLADHPDADPEKTATRMMNVAWLGAAQLLHGVDLASTGRLTGHRTGVRPSGAVTGAGRRPGAGETRRAVAASHRR